MEEECWRGERERGRERENHMPRGPTGTPAGVKGVSLTCFPFPSHPRSTSTSLAVIMNPSELIFITLSLFPNDVGVD